VTSLIFSISGSGRCFVGYYKLIGSVGSCRTRGTASAESPTAPSTEEVRKGSPRGPTNLGKPVERSRPHRRCSKGAAPTPHAASPGGDRYIVASGRCRPRLRRMPMNWPSRNGTPVGTKTGAAITALRCWVTCPYGGSFARGQRNFTRCCFGDFQRRGQSNAPSAGVFTLSLSTGQGWEALNSQWAAIEDSKQSGPLYCATDGAKSGGAARGCTRVGHIRVAAAPPAAPKAAGACAGALTACIITKGECQRRLARGQPTVGP